MPARTLPHDALHRALVARLRASDVASDRVYGADSVPLNPTFPFVTVQVVDAPADYSKDTEAYEVRFAVTARTRSLAGHGNAQEAYALAQSALTSLTATPLAVSGFAVIVGADGRGPGAAPLQSYPSASGTHAHRDLTLTLRTRLQKT